MKSPRFLRRFQEPKTPDFVGEEGIVQRIDLDSEAYMAKHWYSVHGDLGRRLRPSEVDLEEKTVRDPELATTFSPYWHKVKYYEYALIHDLFPETTVKMVGAFDPRLGRDEAGRVAMVDPKKFPVTVTEEVIVDPTVADERTRLLDAMYKEIFAFYDQHGRRPMVAGTPLAKVAAFEATHRVVMDVDAKINQLYGLELGGVRVSDDPESIEQVITALQERGGDPRIIALLEAGVIPMHPEFNFLPTAYKAEPGKSEGVFIELILLHPQRFLAQAIKNADTDTLGHIGKLMDRFVLYRLLDKAYASGLKAVARFMSRDQVRDPEVQSAVLRVLEAHRKTIEGHPARYYNADKEIELITNGLIIGLRPARGREEVIAGLDRLADRVKNTGAF